MRESITPLVLIVAIVATYWIVYEIVHKDKQVDISTSVQVPGEWHVDKTDTDKEIKYSVSKGKDTIIFQVNKPGSK